MPKHLPLLIIAIAFIQRLSYTLWFHPPESFFHSDMQIYYQIAQSILRGEWKVSHFFQPIGFPLLITAIKFFTPWWMSALAYIHPILGTLTLFFLGRSVREFWGRKTEIAALLLGLFHVPWIIYTGYAMPETVYTFLLSLLLWASVVMIKKGRLPFAALWGFVFVIAFWVKGQHVFLLPLFAMVLFIRLKKKAFAPILMITLIVASGLGLHWGWSYAKTGAGKFSADAGGLNFVEGKCPSKKNTDPVTGVTWWSPLYHNLHMSKHKKWDRPFSDSAYYMREGLKCIQKTPWVLVQSLENVPFLFFGNSLWPTNWQPMGEKVRLYELFFVFFAIPGILIFFLSMSLRKDLDELLVWALPILSIFLCVYVFKSEIRFRIPFDIFIIPVAFRGWEIILSRITIGEQFRPPHPQEY